MSQFQTFQTASFFSDLPFLIIYSVVELPAPVRDISGWDP